MNLELNKEYFGQFLSEDHNYFNACKFAVDSNFKTNLTYFRAFDENSTPMFFDTLAEWQENKIYGNSFAGQFEYGFALIKKSKPQYNLHKTFNNYGYGRFEQYESFEFIYVSEKINLVKALEDNQTLLFNKIRLRFQGLSLFINKSSIVDQTLKRMYVKFLDKDTRENTTQKNIDEPFFVIESDTFKFTFNSNNFGKYKMPYDRDENGNFTLNVTEDCYVDVEKKHGMIIEDEITNIRESLELMISFGLQKPSRSLKVTGWINDDIVDIYFSRRNYGKEFESNKVVKPLFNLSTLDSSKFVEYFNKINQLKDSKRFLVYYGILSKFDKVGAENHIINNLQGIQQYLESIKGELIPVDPSKALTFQKICDLIISSKDKLELNSKQIKQLTSRNPLINQPLIELLKRFIKKFEIDYFSSGILENISKLRNKGDHGDNEFFELLDSYSEGVISKAFSDTDKLITLCLMNAIEPNLEITKKLIENILTN